MEAINEFTFWSLLLIALLLGLVSGFLVSYLWLNQDSRARNLQAELERSREELDQYKQKVNQHFQKTAELFEDMTERYREVYRHLAASSQDLCGEQPPALQNPDTRPRLAERGDSGAATAGNGDNDTAAQPAQTPAARTVTTTMPCWATRPISPRPTARNWTNSRASAADRYRASESRCFPAGLKAETRLTDIPHDATMKVCVYLPFRPSNRGGRHEPETSYHLRFIHRAGQEAQGQGEFQRTASGRCPAPPGRTPRGRTAAPASVRRLR